MLKCLIHNTTKFLPACLIHKFKKEKEILNLQADSKATAMDKQINSCSGKLQRASNRDTTWELERGRKARWEMGNGKWEVGTGWKARKARKAERLERLKLKGWKARKASDGKSGREVGIFFFLSKTLRYIYVYINIENPLSNIYMIRKGNV